MKEQWQIDDLSRAIDALNQRKPYTPTDSEVKQLLHTASLVKQYGCSTAEAAMINQLTDQINADITTRRRRKRLVSAIAGVAAAALLFMSVSFQTATEIAQEQNIELAESPQVVVAEKPNVIAHDVNNKRMASLPANSSQPNSQAARSVQPEELPRHAKALSTPADKNDHEVKAKSVAVAEAQKSGDAIVMILPDRSADSVLTEAGGTVRQVYGKNTDKEVIVTQRSRSTATDRPAVTQGLTVAPATVSQAKAAVTLNKATRNVNGVEVVVEGKQSQAELEKMADSLVPASKTDSKSQKKE
jgi:uncharacterized Zn-binding protein involved in type VI secretion